MRREPAQDLVREEQVGEQRAERVQQRQVRPQVVEIRAADAHFAAEFADAFLGGLFRTDGAGDERAVAALLQNFRGNEEVVHDALLHGQFRVELAPDGVKGAVTADKPVEDSLELLDFGFQVPIRTFALTEYAPALVRKDKVPAGATDFAVFERRHELADHIGEEHRVRIAEHEDFALRDFMQAIEHRRLARVLRSLHERNAPVRVLRDNFRGTVGGTVVANQHLELFLGVVNFQNVLDFALDDAFFVIRRNQKRHVRQFKVLVDVAVAALEQFAHERERHGENPVAQRQQEH